jgi:hypothetical protein
MEKWKFAEFCALCVDMRHCFAPRLSRAAEISPSYNSRIHPTLARELRQSKRLQKFFRSLPESSLRHSDNSVREVKKQETRQCQTHPAAEYLVEPWKPNLNPPPLMKAAFARNAIVRRGWNSCRNSSDANT